MKLPVKESGWRQAFKAAMHHTSALFGGWMRATWSKTWQWGKGVSAATSYWTSEPGVSSSQLEL